MQKLVEITKQKDYIKLSGRKDETYKKNLNSFLD